MVADRGLLPNPYLFYNHTVEKINVIYRIVFLCAVSTSQQNIHLLNKLLDQLRLMINCACWGYPLGSTQLWENHLNTINRIVDIANSIQISKVSIRPSLTDLFSELLIANFTNVFFTSCSQVTNCFLN